MKIDGFADAKAVSDEESMKVSDAKEVAEIVTLSDGSIMIGGVRYKRASMKPFRKQSNASLPESCKRNLIGISREYGMALNESVEEAIMEYLSESTERYLPFEDEGSVLVTYYMTDVLEKALKDRAALEDRPIAQIVRKAIYEYVRRNCSEGS